MKIDKITSHILQYDLPEELGYSQQFYAKRTAHLVEVRTDEGLTGWGECFGPGPIALANRAIIDNVLTPMFVGQDPLQRERLWHNAYNMMRDHGQKGMPLQALSGIDIALWDLAAKAAGLPLVKYIGGPCRDRLAVYGYGMMLRREDPKSLCARFAQEAQELRDAGFCALKMKVGLGRDNDIKLVESVREAIGDDCRLMVDANHCYSTTAAFAVGRALDELGVHWFEEPVAPEDRDGYGELRSGLNVAIAGGEAEFTRWGWRHVLEERCLDIAQPEVCSMGGISEYLKVLAMAHAHFTPVINHVWGSAVSVAVNIHLLAAMPDLPGGLQPDEPMLEFDTTDNRFVEEIGKLDIRGQVAKSRGYIAIPDTPGHGVEPDSDLLAKYAIG